MSQYPMTVHGADVLREELNILKTVDDPMYQPLIDSVKGDIYRALGKNKLAQQSYQAAKNGFENSGIVDPFLNMKISE